MAEKTGKTEKVTKAKKVKPELTNAELQILTSEERLKVVVKSHTTLVKLSLTFALIAIITVASLFIFALNSRQHNLYFATTSDGRIVPLTALNQPMLSLQAVETFAARVVSNTFTFDYANYQKQITQNADSFTPSAFTDIKTQLESPNGIVTEAVKNNWVVTATVMAAPQVVKQGVIGRTKTYGWRLIYPVMMTFQNEKDTRSAKYNADILVVRMKQKDYPQGVAIKKIILTPYRY